MRMRVVVLGVWLLLPLSSWCQEEILEEVVVTGIRASMADFYDVPAVTIRKDADFLVQNIRLVNDSRSPELRKSEIIETINNLIKSSTKVKGIELSYGKGFLEPIKLDDESLELLEERGKSDTSYLDIFVKVAFNKNEQAKKQIENLRKFIDDAKLEGRTLIEGRGDIGLSIIKPQQYRYEIIRAISADNKRMKQIVGEECKVSVSGLEGRVFWERVSVGELMLYIGYSTTIKCG